MPREPMLATIKANIISAIRENLVPGLILQAFALSIVLAYFFYEPALPIFNATAALKLEYSTAFAIVATSLFGGFFPFCLLCLRKKIKNKVWAHLLFNLLFWAFMGWLVDSFYQFQSVLFGDGNDAVTVIKKTLLDQFVFSVFITSPFVSAMYIWRASDFQWKVSKAVLKRSYFRQNLPATVFSTWIVWLPAVTLIYIMPPTLQLPLFNLVLFFFVLLLSALNKD